MRGKDKITAKPKKQASQNTGTFKAVKPLESRLPKLDAVDSASTDPFVSAQAAFAPAAVATPAAAASPAVGAHAKPKPPKQPFRHKKAVIVVLIIFVVALIAAWGGGAYYFNTHFGFNTTINNLDVSFKTTAEVEAAIIKQVADYSLSIEGREGTGAVIEGKSIDLVYVPSGQVGTELKTQNPLLWPGRLIPNAVKPVEIADVAFNANKLNRLVAALPFAQENAMRAPVDAVLRYDGKNYVIEPEDIGTTLEISALEAQAAQAVKECAPTLDLDAFGCYIEPALTAIDRSLIERQDLLNKYVRFSITYEFPNDESTSTEVLDGNIAIDWMNIKKDKATLDNDKLTAWVKQFAKAHNTKGSKRSFVGQDGKNYTVKGGTYGWQVNQAKEVDAIKTAIKKHSNETREPYYSQQADSFTAKGEPDWGDTYVEANLKTQKMYYVVKGKVKLTSNLVSGKMDGHGTPEGVYDVIQKLSPTVLIGKTMPNGEPEYRSPVRYWMRITWDGIGLHDANWRSSFGGSIYRYNGSHGCMNLPPAIAAQLYPLIKMHTPVVVHY